MKTTFSQLPQFGSSSFKHHGLGLNKINSSIVNVVINDGVATFYDPDGDSALTNLKIAITATQDGRGTPSVENPRLFAPKTSVTITHNNTTLSIPFGTEAGDVYGGTLNVTTGELTVTHTFKEYIGNENWNITWAETNPAFYLYISPNIGISSGGVFSLFPYVDISSVSGNNGAEVEALLGGTRIVVRYDNMPVTAEAWKQQLAAWKTAGTPFQVVYPMETPRTIQLTPTEIRSLIGNNTLYADTGAVLELA